MIGYYVHHHGAGHAHRFAAVFRHLADDLVGLGSGPRPDGVPADRWIALDRDNTQPEPVDPQAGGILHWAPLHEPGLRARTAAIARWVAEARPRVLVTDVSVEVALTARLLGTPTIVVAQHGTRNDLPHGLAYRSASAVAALWKPGQAVDPPARRVSHIGSLSRFDDRIGDPGPADASFASGGREGHGAATPAGPRRALLLLGQGGHLLDPDGVAAAIDATAGRWTWDLVGDLPGGRRIDDPDALWCALRDADVVVGTAGNNAVAEVAAARRPLIVLPQDRPFGEQHAHAEVLAREGLATALPAWPPANDWATLLERAAASGGAGWRAHHDGGGAERLARLITEVAAA